MEDGEVGIVNVGAGTREGSSVKSPAIGSGGGIVVYHSMDVVFVVHIVVTEADMAGVSILTVGDVYLLSPIQLMIDVSTVKAVVIQDVDIAEVRAFARGVQGGWDKTGKDGFGGWGRRAFVGG
jgi:hypothetical protein